MKTVGIIGGLSPESTIAYYKWLNDGARERLGGNHNARIILDSLDFGEFIALKKNDDWAAMTKILVNSAQNLEKAGADFILLATNTMHKMADEIMAGISIPFLHIADATAQEIKARGIDTIGLLGTSFTMEMDFYKGRLENHGIKTIVPNEAGRKSVNDIIYDELCKGKIQDASRQIYKDIIGVLKSEGAQGIILGCTEIMLLVDESCTDLPLFDTTRIHVDAALREMFS